MSFVNLYDNIVWTDKEITSRTESMIHAVIPPSEELILNRKLVGVSINQYTMTEDDLQLLSRYSNICFIAQDEYNNARSDSMLLDKTLKIEPYKILLDNGPIQEIVVPQHNSNQEEIDKDQEERQIAQEIINLVSLDTIALAQHPQLDVIVSIKTAYNRLLQPIVEPIGDTNFIMNQIEVEQDRWERTGAENVLQNADPFLIEQSLNITDRQIQEAIDIKPYLIRLEQPEIIPILVESYVSNQEQVNQNIIDRENAQNILNSVTDTDVLELLIKRKTYRDNLNLS